MDTAKVDIRKLQLLNDRINQTIDALNQVRFSVHAVTSGQGLAHAGPQGFGQGIGQNPHASPAQGFGLSAMPAFGFQNPALQNPSLGLAHSGIGQGFAPGVAGYGLGQSPMASPVFVNPVLAQNPALLGFPPVSPQGIPFGQPGMAGLSHSGGGFGEAGRGIWGDPYLAAQIAQTFPYAQSPVPPVVTIY